MTDQIIEYAKKQGWNIGFILVIIWQNSRIDKVEHMLFTCYTQLEMSGISHPITKEREIIYAILPTNPIGKIEKRTI